MKKLLLSALIIQFLLIGVSQGNNFNKTVKKDIELVQKEDIKTWCAVSGEELYKNYKTSHTAHDYDGKPRQYASLSYLVFDVEENHVKLQNSKVVDVSSNKLIPTKDAYYVMGSKVKGTKSKISKLAFAKKEDAKIFVSKNGGNIVSFEEAFAEAEKSLKEDMKPSNPKKIQREYRKGKKIYEAKCSNKEIDLKAYNWINYLKADLKNQCKKLKENQLHSVALYLWNVKRIENRLVNKIVEVRKEDKCPVCGMFVYKYPKWAAKLEFVKHEHKHYYVFDGVKDMIKFVHNPKKYNEHEKMTEQKLLVTDYYTQYAIDGKEAFYVVGSDTLGPMGNELIPFKYEEDAKIFLKDHQGTSIFKFSEITSELICKLDGLETCE